MKLRINIQYFKYIEDHYYKIKKFNIKIALINNNENFFNFRYNFIFVIIFTL